MKITLIISGGLAHFPALSRPTIIDTAQIDPQVANELESLIRKSRFFELPERAGTTAKGAADYRTYTITVQDGLRVHTIQFTEPINDSTLEGIVSRLQALARASPP